MKQLAATTGLQLHWVYRRVEAGEIPALKLGRYLRFRPSEVAAWLDSQRLTVRRGAADDPEPTTPR